MHTELSTLLTLAQFEKDTETLIKSINSAWIVTLDLTGNCHLQPPSMVHFLGLLDSPHIRTLKLAHSGLGFEHMEALASYLSSPRSRALQSLTINNNRLRSIDLEAILKTIEKSNHTLLNFDIAECWGKKESIPGAASVSERAEDSDLSEIWEGDKIRKLRNCYWTIVLLPSS
jgi:hypothetical protein